MKKKIIIVFLAIIIVTVSYYILNNSYIYKIDYANLEMRNNYFTNFDSLPHKEVSSVTLIRTNRIRVLPSDLSGTYSLDDSIWLHSESVDSIVFSLSFPTQDTCIVRLDDQSLLYYDCLYNDGYLVVQDENYEFDRYRCEFTPKIPLANIELNITANDIVDFIFGLTEKTKEYPHNNNKGTSSNNGSFLSTIIIPKILENIPGLCFTAIITILAINISFVFLYRKYPSKLYDSLFPKEHSWFGNNTPNDILISVRVHSETENTEYSLHNFFKNAILEKEPTAYAILSNAGGGKTFALSKIALSILNRFEIDKKHEKHLYKKAKKHIPVILNFSEISESKDSEDILEHIYNKICAVADIKHSTTLVIRKYLIKVIQHYLNVGKIVLLVDGYDEINNVDSRLNCSKTFIQFMNEYKKCYYIIASRTNVYNDEAFNNIPTSQTLYISPLSKEQIYNFLCKWSFPQGKSGTEIYRRILNTVHLESMAANPLLLTMIVYTYCRTDFNFIGSKISIYQQCCECLLSSWENHKALIKRFKRFTTVDNPSVKSKLLSILAYHLYTNGVNHIEEMSLLQLWNGSPLAPLYFHGKSKELLDDIISESGLIERTDKNTLRFRHRSFYEYFVALYFVNEKTVPENLLQDIRSKYNIIFFYMSLTEDETIVKNFLRRNSEDTFLLQDIIVERKINDDYIIQLATQNILKNIRFEDVIQMQILGHIAKQYKCVKQLIKHTLIEQLYTSMNDRIKSNALIGLMIFLNFNDLHMVLKSHWDKINLDVFVQYTGEFLDDHAVDIIKIMDNDSLKLSFIELLSKTYRFESIYNIYKAEAKELKEWAIIGFLYMSNNASLLEWLSNKKFFQSTSIDHQRNALKIKEKYGWVDSLPENILNNLFSLIYWGKNILKHRYDINNRLIENKIIFLITYIICEEDNSIREELISIDNFQARSKVEFSSHWNRRKRKKKNINEIYWGYLSFSTLNLISCFILYMTLFSQVVIYLMYASLTDKLFVAGWDIDRANLNNLLDIPFNSVYFAFLFILFLFSFMVYSMIRRMNYGVLSNLISITYAFLLFYIYQEIIPSLEFRILSGITIAVTCAIEIIKHRNNYPSFKEPQCRLISEFLDN